MTADEYRRRAADCVDWANEADTAELRQAYLQMARECLERARRIEATTQFAA